MKNILIATIPALIVGISVYGFSWESLQDSFNKTNKEIIQSCQEKASETDQKTRTRSVYIDEMARTKTYLNCIQKEMKDDKIADINTWTHSTGITVPPLWIKELTLRDKFWLGHCRFINDNHKIPKYNLIWIAYDIACEKGKSFEVRSPWDYRLSYKWYWNNLWNYIILEKVANPEIRIILAHLVNNDEQNTIYSYNDIVWHTNISGASTWIHVHIELWEWYYNVSRDYAIDLPYNKINWTALLNHREWDFGQQKKNVYYFTSYDLWDPSQNDSTPCIWASGKDLCQLERSWVRTMALTSDIRNSLGIKFWDKVRLLWDEDCEWIYEVHDEMNKRFRDSPWVLRPWTPYYIKGDLPSKKWGVCSVKKI